MKAVLSDSLSEIKRANSESADSHLWEIKKIKYDEPHRFKKKANEDQFRFNLKPRDTLEEAQAPCSTQKLDKIKESLDKGEKLLCERQKHILLAVRSNFGWATVHEYKRNDLADDSDDEKKIFRAEARAKSQAKQDLTKNKSKSGGPRRIYARPASPTPSTESTSIPTIVSQFKNQPKPGCCFACGKSGYWRAQCPLTHAPHPTSHWSMTSRRSRTSSRCSQFL